MSSGRPEVQSPICRYIAERTGVALSTQQLGRLNVAIASRSNGRSEEELLKHLKSLQGAADLAELMSVISVHKTDLFRDELQLQAVRWKVLPRLLESSRPLRVWSAGCSTGEEVATLLILLEEAGAHPLSQVLGTDIAEKALVQARELTFTPQVLRRLPDATRSAYFSVENGRYALRRTLAARARFARHNLMDSPYPLPEGGGGFDLIFCRNVLIYFTEASFEKVVSSLADRLSPGGVLVLGAAEPILGRRPWLDARRYDTAFVYVKRTVADTSPPSGPRFAAVPDAPRSPAPRPSTPPAAPAPAPMQTLPRPIAPLITGEFPAINLDPRAEGEQLFQQVMEWAAAGQADDATEAGLRKALYLAPDLAAARYLLGMLLEQRSQNPDAASEYRRALSTLNEGKARETAFFLNPERLKKACLHALARLGYPAT